MRTWVDSFWFQRVLEIIPGFTVWIVLLFPFVFARYAPEAVAYFILIFNLYWFLKALNVSRHLINGLQHMKYNMQKDWLQRTKGVSADIVATLEKYNQEYKKNPSRLLKYEVEGLENLQDRQEVVKKYEDVLHVAIIATFKESYEILDSTVEHLKKVNYPTKKILVVLAGEERDKENFLSNAKRLEEKYKGDFYGFLYYAHSMMPGEVRGKGSGMSYAGKKMSEYLAREKWEPENVLVTNFDADSIVHREYFGRLTYQYIIDPDRDRKTYQPVILLFNNIWDSPAPNRVAAIASSFWILAESMKPYKLRTFSSHTQSLKTLLLTDFWSTTTIVEDGHQYWRTYFAYNSNIDMVSLLLPVYQDCVLDETILKTFKSQYTQRRRWAWGVSDFPFVVKSFIKHPEIPFAEKFLQTFRQFANHLSWASASLLLAVAWVPLLFNDRFMDSVLAHNVTRYSATLFNIAWIGVFFSVWTYFSLLPPKPKTHSRFKYLGMLFQWIFTPPVAIFLGSIPSVESHTRLMLGRYLNKFEVTPKVRKSEATIKQ